MAFPDETSETPKSDRDPLQLLKSQLTQSHWADESDDDDEPPSVDKRGRAAQVTSKPQPRDSSVASSVASLRSTTKEINRRRNRGNRKGKQSTPRASEELIKSLTAAEALGSLEPIPLTRSAASELALLLECM